MIVMITVAAAVAVETALTMTGAVLLLMVVGVPGVLAVFRVVVVRRPGRARTRLLHAVVLAVPAVLRSRATPKRAVLLLTAVGVPGAPAVLPVVVVRRLGRARTRLLHAVVLAVPAVLRSRAIPKRAVLLLMVVGVPGVLVVFRVVVVRRLGRVIILLLHVVVLAVPAVLRSRAIPKRAVLLLMVL
ncbi:hypothetical protein HYU16_04485 [Candidatus Woesearchaeota archaeon]|nr:hypothetical protein [Candidatus Woesearchaeota archaeon]